MPRMRPIAYWVVSASETFLNSLSPEHRKVFMDTLQSEGIAWLNKEVPAREDKLLKEMEASGKTKVVKPDVAAFQKVAGPIVKEFATKNCRPGLLEDIAKYAK